MEHNQGRKQVPTFEIEGSFHGNPPLDKLARLLGVEPTHGRWGSGPDNPQGAPFRGHVQTPPHAVADMLSARKRRGAACRARRSPI